MSAERVYFRLDSAADLILYPDDDVQVLDWHTDLPMIQRFYRHWLKDGDEDVQPPSEAEREVGDPIALVRGSDILSFAILFYFKDGEIEIGAVATLPSEQNRGFCRRVISEAARRILDLGKCATLTTGAYNLAMRSAARSIGMQEIAKD